jgi:hypothetical protein
LPVGRGRNLLIIVLAEYMYPARALYDSCTAVSCLCTAGSDTEIQQCVNCFIPLEPSSTISGVKASVPFNLIFMNLHHWALQSSTSLWQPSASYLPGHRILTYHKQHNISVHDISDASDNRDDTSISHISTDSQVIPSTTTSASAAVVSLPTNNGNVAELSVQYLSLEV